MIYRIQIYLLSIISILALSGTAAMARPDADYMGYMEDVQKRIKHSWQPPHLKNPGKAVVVFKVQPNGEITDAKIKQSSDSDQMDQSALDAVQAASPLPPPPPDPEGVSIQFTFDYNVYKTPRSYSEVRTVAARKAMETFMKQLVSGDANNLTGLIGILLVVLLILCLIIYKLMSLGRPPRGDTFPPQG